MAVIACTRAALRVVVALAMVQIGCSRATLYAVTGGDGDGGNDAPTSPGCASVAAQAGDSSRTLQVGGLSRTYVLHVPSAYDGKTAVPLVLDFHGIGGTGAAELASSPYPAQLDPAGVIMAFPDGEQGPLGSAWNVGPCCVANVDDVAFARAVVADVETVVCVDPNRIYAVGVLTGGGMAHYLACRAADVFAATAPAAFDMLAENVDDCIPARPISVVAFRGTEDPRVPYGGGASSLVPSMPITFLGAIGSFEAWAHINQCSGAPSSPDADGCAHYSGCRDGAEVILCTKQGGKDDPGVPAVSWPVLTRHTL